MIAQRFRMLGWVAGIASASCGLYMISLQVAAERAKLEAVDRRIAEAHRDMQQLKTELSTRASYRQLEKWNDETLSLAIPRAAQYLNDEAQLASLAPDMLDKVPDRIVPRAQLVAATAAAPSAPVPAIAPPTSAPAPAVRAAAYVPDTTTVARPQRVALTERPMLARNTLSELSRAAAAEGRTTP
jgi:hypothetical protein